MAERAKSIDAEQTTVRGLCSTPAGLTETGALEKRSDEQEVISGFRPRRRRGERRRGGMRSLTWSF